MQNIGCGAQNLASFSKVTHLDSQFSNCPFQHPQTGDPMAGTQHAPPRLHHQKLTTSFLNACIPVKYKANLSEKQVFFLQVDVTSWAAKVVEIILFKFNGQ